MRQGSIIILSDATIAKVVRGAESGLTDILTVVLTNGFLRLIDDKRNTLLYSLSEVSSNKF